MKLQIYGPAIAWVVILCFLMLAVDSHYMNDRGRYNEAVLFLTQ